jgi:hypothetical protein
MFKEAEVLPGMAKGVGEFAVDAALTVPRAKAAMYADPEGSKEFVGKVASGDREARKKLATGASESMVEPAATMGDAALAKYAAEEGKYGEAALYGGMILLPGVLQLLGKSMSKGWLKSAAEAGEEIPDEAAKKMNDLAKRVDEGKVTDDMQIRRELAQIEDDHAYDYQASLGDRDTDFDFESVSGKPPGGGGRSRFQNFEEDLRRIAIERDQFELTGSEPSGVLPDQATLDELQELDYLMGQHDGPLSAQQINQRRTEIMEEFYANNPQLRGGGTPSGGGVAAFKANEAAKQEYRRSKGLGVYEPELSSPKFGLSNQGHHNVVEDLGPLLPEDRYLLEEFSGKYNLSETELRQLRDEYVAYGYDDFPGRSERGFEEIDIPGSLPIGGRVPEFTEDTGIDQYKKLVMSFADEGRPFSFTEVFTDPSQPFDQDLYKAVDELVAEGRISGPSPFDDNVYDEFGRPLTHDTMVYTKTPSGGGRYSVLDEGWGGDSKLTNRYINEMQDKLYGEVQGKLPKSVYRDQLIKLQRMGEQEAAIISGDLEISRAHAEQIFADNADTRQKMAEFIQRREGGRSIDDIEGPSEAEIQQMIEQSRFGDPEELEMLKEDMRRLAELQQRAQLEPGRVRGTRTPSVPGASSKVPEGTSRAERKGTPRERPKKKE